MGTQEYHYIHCLSDKRCILYDTPEAYQEWNKALKNKGSSALPALNGKKRYPGNVDFTVYQPNKEKTALIKIGGNSLR